MVLPDAKPPENAIDYIAIGSVHLLGLFLVLDSISGFLSLLETYSNSAAWAIVAAIPVLVFAYILGLFSVVIAEGLFSRATRTPDEADLILHFAPADNTLLARKFLEVSRLKRVLLGSTPAFIALAVGFIFEIPRQAETLKIAFYVIVVGFLLIALASPVLALHLNKQAIAISRKAASLKQRAGDHSSE